MAEFAIKENILGGEHSCAVCGGVTTSHFGPDLFMEGTMQLVCRDCGRDYAPHLVHLLEFADREGYSARM